MEIGKKKQEKYRNVFYKSEISHFPETIWTHLSDSQVVKP